MSAGGIARTASLSVLVVDDEEDFLAALAADFARIGHRVSVARCGADADLEIRADRFDRLVVDALLPDVDGVAWIAALRARGVSTPVTFVSAYAGFIEVASHLAPRLGIAAVLSKPVTAAEIAATWSARLPPRRGSGTRPRVDPEAALLLETARREYAARLAPALAELSEAARRARSEGAETALIEELRLLAHRLRGTAGSFGLDSVAQAAGAIEDATTALGEDPTAAWSAIDRALAIAASAGSGDRGR